MNDRFEAHGLKFAVDIEHDSDMRAPWLEHDGHGVVVDYFPRYDEDKYWPLSDRRGPHWLYDVEASRAKAKAEGWGGSEDPVQADYDHLLDWVEERWYWCGVIVTLLDVNEDRTPIMESLWGIESDSDEYIEKEVVPELAEQIVERVGEGKQYTDRVTTYTVRR